MQRLDSLRMYSFFERNGELLQIIAIDFLDCVVEVYNHKKQESMHLGQYEYVKPVDVFINSSGVMLPVQSKSHEEEFWQNAADNLINIAPIIKSAAETIKGLGYTYHGGVQWRPPLAKKD